MLKWLLLSVLCKQQAFWRDQGLSGEVVTSGGPSIVGGCDTGPLCIIFDAMSSSADPAIVAFIGGDQQIQYSRLKVSATVGNKDQHIH